MLNPLSAFKQTFLKDIKVMGKTFTFDTSKPIKTLNKVDILVDTLKAVNNVNLEDFSTTRDDIDKGLTLKQAKKKEIESWDPEIINILVKKYINIIKNKKPIDFKNLPDLRIYWKIRKIFGKDEVDNWSDIDYQWAIYNIQEDYKDQDDFDNWALEKRKPWYSVELYNYLNKKQEDKKQQEQENKLLIQKMMEKEGLNSNDFQIELIDKELPSIIEETNDALNEDKK